MKYKSLFWLFGLKSTLLLNPALPAISTWGICADRYAGGKWAGWRWGRKTLEFECGKILHLWNV